MAYILVPIGIGILFAIFLIIVAWCMKDSLEKIEDETEKDSDF
jgi:hypothetical protein